MPATLYLRPSPRAFFLLTDAHALIFRQPDAAETKASRSVVVAEFLPLDEVDMRGLIKASKGTYVEGVLGVTSVPTERSPVPEIFLLLVSTSSILPPLLPNSSLRPARVVGVEFHSLSSSFWDAPELAAASVVDYDLDDPYPPSYPSASSTQSQASQQGIENPCNGMRKYIESGGFFYAKDVDWDISTRMGETNWIQAEKDDGLLPHPLETYDERFVWNTNLLIPLLDFRRGLPEDQRRVLDAQSLIIPVIQGFCGSSPNSTNQWGNDGRPEIAALALISRLSWKRAGARFRTRGIDDDGQVANFVETELILATEGVTMSYAQVRGSVPLFWQQPQQGIQTLQQRVEITRPPQASQPAFDKHFIDLLEHYHSVHAVNLLGQKDAESMLSTAYSDHLANLQRTLEKTPASEKAGLDATPRGTISLTPYDFHASLRVGGHEGIKFDFQAKLGEVVRSMDNFGWTAIDTASGQIIEQQKGVFRVNCLDCLDRTNYVQDVISSITLGRFLESIGSPLVTSPTLWSAHRELWADNGDRLSKIYAGTGALNTSATRTGKKTFAGMLSDATKSVGRAYINNFQDKGKQAAIDMLLGMMSGQRPVILFDPISDSVQSALTARINEFSRTKSVTLFCGTWNLNGKAPDEALDDWLWPAGSQEADIYAIAFQEIVELTAGQILQTDPAKRRMWEKYIMDTFAMRQTKSKYILYRSEQLVGTALIIVAKVEVSSHIRRVESATKKTGLQGLSGNKGGVGIRLDLFDSSICFMTCHLAAGHSNVNERNADYRTISTGMKFLRGRKIEDHDIVIWFADFNYRVALPNADVREYAESRMLDPLLAADQLLQAMDDGEVFQGYDEGPITFPPTYKYDNGTDTYDTSEKARIPAWTDRVLFKGPSLRLKDYNRADLRTSDHRPVYAVFDATIRVVDHAKRDAIQKELLHTIRLEAGEGKIDRKIERVTNGGVSSIVKGLTHTSVSSPVSRTPPPSSHRPGNGIPHLPPRPQATTNSYRSFPANAPALPTRPSSSTKKPEASPSFAIARKPAPPIPARTPSTTSVASLMQPSPGKRAPPPIPSNRGISHRPPSPAPPGSPILTPASTGDFMLITSPTSSRNGSLNGSSKPAPPLPPRAPSSSDAKTMDIPQPRPSLDLSGPAPVGLISPVLPDSATKTSYGVTDVQAKALAKGPPPLPPATASKPKPVVPAKATHPLLREADQVRTEAIDPVPVPVSSSPPTGTSPTKKAGPPLVPKKPAALRRGSLAGHDQ